jgi:hypothetical protein
MRRLHRSDRFVPNSDILDYLKDRGRRGSRRIVRRPALWTSQLFKSQLGNLRRVLNPQPANRNDLLGDKLRDGVVAIFETQRPQSLFVSRH